ncbi:MAG: hydrogenase 4 subunit B [Chloroflexi bacterium]|nr:hydrogenase 4 subunit B [Chloroflexota bacterium]
MESPEAQNWLAPVGLYLIGALLALILPRHARVVAHGIAGVGSLIGVGVALSALLAGTVQQVHLFSAAPYAVFTFRLDPLSAWFLLVLSTVACAVSLYAIGYLGEEHGGLSGLGAGYNLFLATMVLVVLADSVFAFLFAWEAMSLVSFFLVIHDHQHAGVRRAGFVYIVMTHLGTAFLLGAFLLLLVNSETLDFAGFRAAREHLTPLMRDGVFLLALVGFATKAGVIPLHVWLPRAHPAAPSHISALMSGVMIKTAIYGLVRVAWDFAGPGPAWWGVLVLALGAVSAVLGVLYALMEHDLKRLLAYHSVENIGIILIGIGAAQVLTALDQPAAAALALAAGLFHVLNHAVFKALLFLGAGAVQRATHTRDLERLGGLIRTMPWTAATFLVGAMAISALPPLNGFMSEWLIFQGLLRLAGATRDPLAVAGAAAAAGLLALTGGLAAFCFVKAFGIAFLGISRSALPQEPREVVGTMRAGMALLAGLCVALGLGAGGVMTLLGPVTVSLVGTVPQAGVGVMAVPAAPGGAVAPVGALGVLLALGGVGLLLARLLGGPARSRVAPPWVCGIALEPSMQYSASALAKPIRIIFRALVRPYRAVEREHAALPYFVTAVRYEAGVLPVYERYLYRPLVQALVMLAQQVRALQNGSLRLYLGYMFATVVVVLLLTR